MDFPTSWDETKLINGYPGEVVVIARRKGKLWSDTKAIASETKNVKKSNTLQIQCLPMGGFAGVIGHK